MSKPTIVQLRIYKGAQITRGEQNQVLNQNQTLKLRYDTKEWHNFISKMWRNGWGRVTTEAVKIDKGGEENWSNYEDVSDDLFRKIDAEVQSQLKKTDDKPLTKEQKEIKALTAQVAELVAASKNKAVQPVDSTPKTDEERDAAKERYKGLFGKYPHHATGLAKIITDCEEKEAEQE